MAKCTSLTDSNLAKGLKSGDKTSFNEIYHLYWEKLYRSAYAVLKDGEACDDIIQEIFVWLWVNRSRHQIVHFESYLRAAVKYKVANAIRHGRVKNNFYEKVQNQLAEAFTESSDSLEVKELKAAIICFTETLPARARQIFEMSRFQYLSNKEIATQMGISEKTVENQMNISLKKLRISLRKMSFWSTFI